MVSKGEERLVMVMSSAESMTGPMAMSAVPSESMLTRPAVLFGSLSSDTTCNLHYPQAHNKSNQASNTSIQLEYSPT